MDRVAVAHLGRPTFLHSHTHPPPNTHTPPTQQLPALVPAVLDVLGPVASDEGKHPASSASNGAPGSKEAALVCVTALLAAVPQFLNPFLPRLVGRLLSTHEGGGAAAEGAASSNMAHALALLATAIPPRLLLPVLFAQFAEAAQEEEEEEDGGPGVGNDGLQRAQGAVRLLAVLRQAIEHHKRGDLLQGQGLAGITAFVLRVLNFRAEVLRPLLLREEGESAGSETKRAKKEKKRKDGRKQRQEEEERGFGSVSAVVAACDAVEAAACEAVVALVLRLNEEELRPLFLTLAHWRGEGVGEGLPRRLPFFRVVDALAEKLRVRACMRAWRWSYDSILCRLCVCCVCLSCCIIIMCPSAIWWMGTQPKPLGPYGPVTSWNIKA